MKIGFHGDVTLKPIQALPGDLKPVGKKLAKGSHISRPDFILAEGEHTGHAHRIACEDGEVELFEKNGTLYLKVNSVVSITHEEHKPVTLEPGFYEAGFQREWDYVEQMERQVMD